MRYILVSAVISLLTIMMWPWITQFFTWAHKEYKRITNFNETESETKNKTSTPTKQETKNTDDN